MEVLLLGTGAADGWPSPFCTCASCADSRQRRQVRRPTAALVDDVVLIDAGPTVSSAAAQAGRSLRAVEHIVVTHAHPDHLDPSLLLWLHWNPTDHPVHIWGPAGVLAACSSWIGPTTPVELHLIGPGDRVTLATVQGHWQLTVLAAAHDPGDFGGMHDDLAAEALLLDLAAPDGRRLLYATDTGPLPQDTLEAVRDARFDIILIEETFGDHTRHRTGHLDLATLPDALASLRSVGAATDHTDVVAVHLGHHNPPQGELQPRLAALGVRLVDDGTVLGRSRRTLILGGARSGKSSEAERRALAFADVCYVATAAPRPGDEEWATRVQEHQRRRPTRWITREGPDAVVPAVESSRRGQAVIVDCLTLWLTGVLDAAAHGQDWDGVPRETLVTAADAATSDLVAALDRGQGTIWLVSNEVGMGIVPLTPSGRLFADLLGRLNQAVAARCDETVLMVAGRALTLAAPR